MRPIDFADAMDVYEYAKQESVGRNAGWRAHKSIEDTLEMIETNYFEKRGVFGIVLKRKNKMIGSIGLVEDPKRENDRACMMGYALSEPYWGQGIMTESVKRLIQYGFGELKLDLISAYCYPHNLRSKRVLEKCGFVHEGTLSQCERIDGKIYDIECYVLIRREQSAPAVDGCS